CKRRLPKAVDALIAVNCTSIAPGHFLDFASKNHCVAAMLLGYLTLPSSENERFKLLEGQT
ncbi:MAG: hypothetical protein ACO21T_11190, partial [Alphaproteobacteria bacterium]